MTGATTLPIPVSQRAGWCAQQAIGFLMQQAVENPGCLSLAAGLVDESAFPVSECQRGLATVLGTDASARAALQYGSSQGLLALRQQICEHVARLEQSTPGELGLKADQLLLTTGSQQFLSIVAETLFDPGDLCLVAAPTYFVFLGVLQGVGARAVPVAADHEGMQPTALEAKLVELEAAGELARVKAVYVVSEFENPSGARLTLERRQAIVDLVQRWSKTQRLMILEDSAYRELRYDGPPLPSLWRLDRTRSHVLYTQTFSKSFSPGVRVGFGFGPADLLTALVNRKSNEDFGSPNLNQHLLSQVFRSGRYEEHVALVAATYREKRDAMLQALETEFAGIANVHWAHPDGGLYVWLTLPPTCETGFHSRLFEVAVHTRGVMFVPGELCYPTASECWTPPRNQARLSFGVLSCTAIREGIRRLAAAVRDVL